MFTQEEIQQSIALSNSRARSCQLIEALRKSGIAVHEKDGAIVLESLSDSQVIKAREICEAIGKVFDVSSQRI